MVPLTLVDMAHDYLSHLRKVQPRGPYHLLGWSFGGYVAFEIANILAHNNETVASLVLLDTYPPPRKSKKQKPLNQQRIDDGLPVDVQQFRSQNKRSIFASLSEAKAATVLEVTKHNVALQKAYVPSKYDGDLMLFVARKGAKTPAPQVWRPFVGGEIKVYEVDCHHGGMTRPRAIAQIGGALRIELDRMNRSRVD
jgi:thioesterase domain-containing protein